MIRPYCGENRNQKRSDELNALIKHAVLISEQVHVGGRELIFKTKGAINLSDQCDNCDHAKLEKFLK